MPPRKAPYQRDTPEQQVLLLQQDDGVSHVEFRASFTMLAQALANQANRKIAIPPQVPNSSTHIRDFKRMCPLEFHRSKMEEDPIDFIDEAYWVEVVMGIPLKKSCVGGLKTQRSSQNIIRAIGG